MKKSDWIKVDWTKEGGFPEPNVPVLVYWRGNDKTKSSMIVAHIEYISNGTSMGEAVWVDSGNGFEVSAKFITHFQYLPDDPE